MTPRVHFIDRDDAGRRLGDALRAHADDESVIVLGLPRGGIVVAARVAERLGAPLDVCVVRKLGVPGHEEVAFGAIASGGALVFSRDVVEALQASRREIERVVAAEEEELERREQVFRGNRPFPDLTGKTVILVDDGAATGASMSAAITSLRQRGGEGPKRIIVALPVASRGAAAALRSVADEVVVITQPEPFYGVGVWYDDFHQTTDGEVRLLLAEAHQWDVYEPLHVGARTEQ